MAAETVFESYAPSLFAGGNGGYGADASSGDTSSDSSYRPTSNYKPSQTVEDAGYIEMFIGGTEAAILGNNNTFNGAANGFKNGMARINTKILGGKALPVLGVAGNVVNLVKAPFDAVEAHNYDVRVGNKYNEEATKVIAGSSISVLVGGAHQFIRYDWQHRVWHIAQEPLSESRLKTVGHTRIYVFLDSGFWP